MMRPNPQASEAGVSTETEQVGQAAVAARDHRFTLASPTANRSAIVT